MAKLKTFEQFMDERDRAEEIQQDVVDTTSPDSKGPEEAEEEAEEVQGHGEEAEVEDDAIAVESTEEVTESCEACGEAECVCETSEEETEEESTEEVNEGLHAKLKKAQKAIKDGETVYGENVRFPGRFKIIELGDMFATVDYEDGTKPMEMASMNIRIDSLQFESVETVETVETEEVNENPAAAIAVASMLQEVYEACKEEAKAYEDDAHDDHTVESYMKENAALVATLAAASLKEMKEEYSTEAYESACNEMIESYTKKMNEMKESEDAMHAEDME